MTFINLTPHDVRVTGWEDRYLPSCGVARCSVKFTPFDENGVCMQEFGEVYGLPDPEPGVRYVVSTIVLTALRGIRFDLVAPATGHPDCVRDAEGQIVSVPGFVTM